MGGTCSSCGSGPGLERTFSQEAAQDEVPDPAMAEDKIQLGQGVAWRLSSARTVSCEGQVDLPTLSALPESSGGERVGEAEWQAMMATMHHVVGPLGDSGGPARVERGYSEAEMWSPKAAALADHHEGFFGRPDAEDAWEDEMQRDAAFAALQEGRPLYTLPEPLRADKEIVLAAIAREGAYCFDYIASHQLRTEDRDVVMALVMADGTMLEHASPALRADKQIVLVALRTYADALQLAPKSLQADKELKARATNRGQEEQRLMKHYAAKACGPGVVSCMAR